jgi:hypothetical protein
MLKKIGFGSIVAVVLSLFISHALFAAPNKREGMWEIKGEMKIEGLSFPVPPVPVNYTQCLTNKDMIPYKKEKDQDCKMISNKTVGNTVTWIMQCKDRYGVTDSTGKIVFKGNSFAGTVQGVTKDSKDVKRSESILQMSGKRTGDCK